MGCCQNDDPLLGSPRYQLPYCNKEPKRDHNFDNHHIQRVLSKIIRIHLPQDGLKGVTIS